MSKKIKAYFTAATSYDGDPTNLYQNIIDSIRQNQSTLLSGEQIVNKDLLKLDKSLTRKQIFLRERKFIGQADCVVADVTKPSLGVGSEIDFALSKSKPVLALVREGYEDRLSPIILGNTSENLLIEYYNEDKLPFLIKDFLNHVQTKLSKKGKFIVIDGGDGSGKTVQASLLVETIKKQKLPVKYLDFPQYYNSFHGKTVAKLMRGDFGNINQVSPYLASLAYALDRLSVKNESNSFLAKGGFIISNRYATSNLAHQGAKFKIPKERDEFLKWVYDLEYKTHRIPKEDLVVYLYVPWQIGISLSKTKGNRKYLEGNKDIHEQDVKYRQEVEKMYLYLSKKYKHWVKIDCVDNGKILPRGEINRRIVETLKKRKILSH